MSVYIKGMEMPKNCYSCDFGKFHSDGGQYCGRHMRSVNSGLSRPDWCPLVPVPPHGRLGDLDALLEGMNTLAKYENGWIIDGAPTIIPPDDK